MPTPEELAAVRSAAPSFASPPRAGPILPATPDQEAIGAAVRDARAKTEKAEQIRATQGPGGPLPSDPPILVPIPATPAEPGMVLAPAAVAVVPASAQAVVVSRIPPHQTIGSAVPEGQEAPFRESPGPAKP